MFGLIDADGVIAKIRAEPTQYVTVHSSYSYISILILLHTVFYAIIL